MTTTGFHPVLQPVFGIFTVIGMLAVFICLGTLAIEAITSITKYIKKKKREQFENAVIEVLAKDSTPEKIAEQKELARWLKTLSDTAVASGCSINNIESPNSILEDIESGKGLKPIGCGEIDP